MSRKHHIIHTGTIRLSRSNALSLSDIHSTAPVPSCRGDLSITLKVRTRRLSGVAVFLISGGQPLALYIFKLKHEARYKRGESVSPAGSVRARSDCPPDSHSLRARSIPLIQTKEGTFSPINREKGTFGGGGEGSRTPVQKSVRHTFYERSRLLKNSLRVTPLRQASPSGSFMIHDTLKALRIHVHC